MDYGYDFLLTVFIVLMGALYIGWHFAHYILPVAVIFLAAWILWFAIPKLFKGPGNL